MYGINKWADFFSPRQLLTHAAFVQAFRKVAAEARTELDESLANDILTELALMQGKALNYNARQATWDVGRQKTRSVFEKHNFAFKWTFVEFPGPGELLPWCLDQLVDAYDEIARLLEETGSSAPGARLNREVQVTAGTAADIPSLSDGSIQHICMDPPYYANVMYSELSNFFYAWERETLGFVTPELFEEENTDLENEAVTNGARFAALGRRKKEIADLDYEAKMAAIFIECRRLLSDDGVLTVMFTNKNARAWDALGSALIAAGFTVETSWPVATEPESSSHQANKNAAESTIMLVCRKRDGNDDGGKRYLEDVAPEVRTEARSASLRFAEDGIEGVDLMLATYGPALSVISRNWPVYSSVPDENGADRLLRPEEALNIAREEIVELRRRRLVGEAVQVDSLTDFVLMAWDIFKAREADFDAARLLALAVGGLDIDHLTRSKVLKKKAGTVELLAPEERIRRGNEGDAPGVRPEAARFEYLIDAVDTMLYIAEVDGMQAAKRFVDRHGYTSNRAFIASIQGLVNAIPRKKSKGAWVYPEAGLLDTLCTLYFDSVQLPADDLPVTQIDEPVALFEVE
jgi:adenine-specific DNA methylase